MGMRITKVSFLWVLIPLITILSLILVIRGDLHETDWIFVGLIIAALIRLSVLLMDVHFETCGKSFGKEDKSSAVDFKLSGNTEETRKLQADALNLPYLKDIAGLSEVKKDLMNVLEAFKQGDRYKSEGIVPPTGILLYGEPGCGKTMLAKAVARECNVNFLARNAGELCRKSQSFDFDNTISKLFKEARKLSPCVIFIDELDIFGSRSFNGGKEELTQLIAEMDGFAKNEGILIIGATNSIHSLDRALLRAGRFTRKYNISSPQSVEDIQELVEMYCIKERLDGITDEVLCRVCGGMTPADIKAMFQIATTNASLEHRKVTQVDLVRTKTELTTGSLMSLKSRFTKADIERRVAVHEIGHTILNRYYGKVIEGVNVLGITSAAGITSTSKENGEELMPISFYKERIAILYGGIANEEIEYGTRDDVSLGAGSDIEIATRLLKCMCMYPTYFASDGGLLDISAVSENLVPASCLAEMRKVSQEIFVDAKEILLKNKDISNAMVALLLEKKELSSVDVEEFFKANPVRK